MDTIPVGQASRTESDILDPLLTISSTSTTASLLLVHGYPWGNARPREPLRLDCPLSLASTSHWVCIRAMVMLRRGSTGTHAFRWSRSPLDMVRTLLTNCVLDQIPVSHAHVHVLVARECLGIADTTDRWGTGVLFSMSSMMVTIPPVPSLPHLSGAKACRSQALGLN